MKMYQRKNSTPAQNLQNEQPSALGQERASEAGTQTKQNLVGNQAMLAQINEAGPEAESDDKEKPQKCACGGFETGNTRTKREGPGSSIEPEWLQRDQDLENIYDQWVHYDKGDLKNEMDRVKECNKAFDQLNAEVILYEGNRWERHGKHLDEEALTENVGIGGPTPSAMSHEKGSKGWKNHRDHLHDTRTDMWKKADKNDDWSGFEGDLDPIKGVQDGPRGPSRGFHVAMDEFLKTYRSDGDMGKLVQGADGTKDPTVANQQLVPFKGYKHFEDQRGKPTAVKLYGFADQQPSIDVYRFRVYRELNWCEMTELQTGTKTFSKTPKPNKHLTRDLFKPRPKTTGFKECEKWEKRHYKTGKAARTPAADDWVEQFLARKEAKGEEFKAYHEERHEFLETMEAATKDKTPGSSQ